MDMSLHFRKSEPTVYGMFPTRANGDTHTTRRTLAMFLGDFAFVTAHNAGRVLAITVGLAATAGPHAPAGSAARWLVPAWLLAEFVLLNLFRHCVADSWTHWMRGMQGYFLGVLWNIFGYLLLFCPLPWARHPFCMCPHIYAGGVVGTNLSNAALLIVSLRVGATPPSSVAGMSWFGLAGVFLAAEVLGALALYINMVPAYRKTYVRTTHILHPSSVLICSRSLMSLLLILLLVKVHRAADDAAARRARAVGPLPAVQELRREPERLSRTHVVDLREPILATRDRRARVAARKLGRVGRPADAAEMVQAEMAQPVPGGVAAKPRRGRLGDGRREEARVERVQAVREQAVLLLSLERFLAVLEKQQQQQQQRAVPLAKT